MYFDGLHVPSSFSGSTTVDRSSARHESCSEPQFILIPAALMRVALVRISALTCASSRIGVLLPAASDDAEFQARVGAFLQELSLLGWAIGRNVRIDTRWAAANADQIRRHAAELAALAPDIILAFGSSTVGPMMQASRSGPIRFPRTIHP